MDRELSQNIKNRRKWKIYKRIGLIVSFIVVVAVVLPGFIRKEAEISKYDISVVDRGRVEVSFSCNGKVKPEVEKSVSSVLSGKIVAILKNQGDKISTEDTVMILDNSEYIDNLNKLNDEISLINIKKDQMILTMQEENDDAGTQQVIDSMQIALLASNLKQEKHLMKLGGSSKEAIDKIETEHKLAMIKHDLLIKKMSRRKKKDMLALQTLSLELSIKNRIADEIKEKISEAYVKSDMAGVITKLEWQTGQMASNGQLLFEVADLNHFKVRGKTSSKNVNKVYINQNVIIKVDDVELEGNITKMSPDVSDGFINFDVALKNSSFKNLRTNAGVEVRLVTSTMSDVLRIDNKSFYNGAGLFDIYVMQNDELILRKVELGGCSFDKVEVKSGLKEGETVVVNNKIYEKFRGINKVGVKK